MGAAWVGGITSSRSNAFIYIGDPPDSLTRSAWQKDRRYLRRRTRDIWQQEPTQITITYSRSSKVVQQINNKSSFLFWCNSQNDSKSSKSESARNSFEPWPKVSIFHNMYLSYGQVLDTTLPIRLPCAPLPTTDYRGLLFHIVYPTIKAGQIILDIVGIPHSLLVLIFGTDFDPGTRSLCGLRWIHSTYQITK